MTEELVIAGDQLDLIKRTVAKGTTNDELQLFLYTCRRTGLDPLTNQIYCVKRKGIMTIQTSIDGYRAIADRTGKYAGNDDPVFDSEEHPKKASVTVYKLVDGMKCAFSATARWSQYFPGDSLGFMWKRMPHLMLGKCAEALALRKAFPQNLSGIYTSEEMEQADSQQDFKRPARKYDLKDEDLKSKKAPEQSTSPVVATEVWPDTTVAFVDEEPRDDKTFYRIRFADGKEAWTVNEDLAGNAFDLVPDTGEEPVLVTAQVKLGKKGTLWWLESLTKQEEA